MHNNRNEALIYLSEKLPVSCTAIVDKSAQENLPVSCLDRINDALVEAVYILGYDCIRYSYWAKNVVQQQQQTNAFSVNITNFPSAWEAVYDAEYLYLTDPIVRLIQENMADKNLVYGTWREAYSWGMLHPLGQNEEEKQTYINNIRQLINRAAKYELNSGYYYSWGSAAAHIVMSLASSKSGTEHKDTSSEDFARMIHSMVVLINQAIAVTQGCKQCSKSLRIDGSDTIHLSQSELQVLQLFHKHRNATLKQIAAHYGRSVDTVNHHLRSIRSKFNRPGASGHSLAAQAADLRII